MKILSDTLSTQLDALRQGRADPYQPDPAHPDAERRSEVGIAEPQAESPAAEVRDPANDLLLADVWGDTVSRSLTPAGPLPASDGADPADWAGRLAHYVLA